MTLTFEKMIRADSGKYVCRIWRAIVSDGATDDDLKRYALGSLMAMEAGGSIENAVSILVGYESVSAVEIISRQTGDGLCVYKNWP